MLLISWEKRYLIGIGEIDETRRHLVDLLNEIYTGFVNKRPNSYFMEILEELIDSGQHLFLMEESLMSECCYPDIESHRACHDKFINRLEEIQDSFVRCNRNFSLELLTCLRRWLLEHIFEIDVKLGDFITTERNQNRVS
ncbi:MAG: bacteriohemerythrin [Desulfobulbus sp.]